MFSRAKALDRLLGVLVPWWFKAFAPSDDLAVAAAGDLGGAAAEFAQDLVGVLAHLGRRRLERARRARQCHRLTDEFDGAALRRVERLRHAEVLDLGVGEDLVHGIDRAAR